MRTARPPSATSTQPLPLRPQSSCPVMQSLQRRRPPPNQRFKIFRAVINNQVFKSRARSESSSAVSGRPRAAPLTALEDSLRARLLFLTDDAPTMIHESLFSARINFLE